MKQIKKHVFFNEEENEVYLAVCPVCKRENDVNHIPHGVCAWCGYDAREMVDGNNSLK